MKVKRLKNDEMRVISIDGKAVFELLTETMMENAERFFDLLDVTKVSFRMQWCEEENCFVCAIVDGDDFKSDFDLQRIAQDVGETTESLYLHGKKRYCTVDAGKYRIDRS